MDTKKVENEKSMAMRDALIAKLYNEGWSAIEIAGIFKLTRQMVHLILKKYEESI